MKRNLRKRIGAVALAIAVSLTMGVTSFAADTTPGTGDDTNNPGVIVSNSNTIVIPKGITATLEGDSITMLYGPTITYQYTIAPATITSGSTINDGTATVSVKQGIAGGVTLGNDGKVVFTSAEVPKGEIKENLTATVDISKFTDANVGAGVYRYVIEDKTTQQTLFDAGITRPTNYNPYRYLDVYIHNTNEGLAVYGYVLQNENVTNTDKDNNAKSQGYVAASEKVTDAYHTINIKVGKKTTGTMGDKTHEFPVAVTLNNFNHSYYAAENTDPTIENDVNASTFTLYLKDGENYLMLGLNPRATITYTETNNTSETYTVTIQDIEQNPVNGVSETSTGPGVTRTSDVLNVSNYTKLQDVSAEVAPSNYQDITFINMLNEISPTNVVMRYAPFLFIFGAAILLLVVMRKRRSHSAE